MTADPDLARSQRQERLFGALANISTLSTLPDGRVDESPTISELLSAADDLARRSELEALSDQIASRTANYPEAAKVIVSAVRMRADDRLILGHGDTDLRLLRVDYGGQSARVPELDVTVRPTVAGSIVLESSSRDERTIIAFAAEIQIIVGGEEEVLSAFERQLAELEQDRGRDAFRLQGQFALSFELGVGMRAAWGCGTVTVTNQRVLGAIFTDDLTGPGQPPAREAAWMPPAWVASDLSSMILFAFPRTAVSEVEVLDSGFFASRVPYANVHGQNFTVALDTTRVFEADRLVKPKKNQLGDPIRALSRP